MALFRLFSRSLPQTRLVAQTTRCFSGVAAKDLPQIGDPMPEPFHLNSDGNLDVTPDVVQSWQHNGFIVVKQLLSKDELSKITLSLESKGGVLDHAFEVDDGAGRKSMLCLWNHPGEDITGMLGRTEKVAGTAAKLLDGEVYHYHSKLMCKSARTGGRFAWHQDYGYWYKNDIMFPQMLTAFIAVDKCTPENGCMQVLRGSHHAGRIEHTMVGEQTGADIARVEHLQKVLPEDLVELDAGDCLFFHSNTLHKSNANTSPNRRWAFLCAYNRASNNALVEHHHAQYTPLDLVPNSAVMDSEVIVNLEGKDFLDPSNDKTIAA